MKTRIHEWEHSLGLRIPTALASVIGVEVGSEVELTVRDGELRVRPIPKRPLLLRSLLRKGTAANAHGEIETAHPPGLPCRRGRWRISISPAE